MSSSCPIIKRLLFIETRFLSPIAAISFFLPFCAPHCPRAGHRGSEAHCPMNLPQVSNYPAPEALSQSWQPHAACRPCCQRWKTARPPPVPPCISRTTWRRGMHRKEFVRDAREGKACLEEKAEVKIRKRKSANTIQTGARALRVEQRLPTQTLHSYCRRRSSHSDWF
jgi:hypothetical protein